MSKDIFESYTLNNGVVIRNRLVIAPITLWCCNEDGSFGEGDFLFMQHRGENIGMFIVEATLVAKGGNSFGREPEAISEQNIESLKKVADLLKKQGTKAILQIHHGGNRAVKGINKEIVAPSDDPSTGARALTSEEIKDLVKAFGNAAELALKAGFDGVEIHGANRFLIHQFVSGFTNKRTDEWGGSREKRMKFSMDIIDCVDAVKKKHNANDFIVGYRFSPEEPQEDGLTMEDTFALIDKLITKPLQYLHVSLGNYFKKCRRGADTNKYRIDLIHQRINGKLPLIGVGFLFTADDLIKAYNTGYSEFVAVAKCSMMNKNLGTLMFEKKYEQIETQIDPNNKEKYDLPESIWERLKGENRFLPFKGDPPLVDKSD